MFEFVNHSPKSGATGTALRTRAHSRRKTRVRKAVPVAAGFTLVELLVSLGLISLIMLMFSQVFTIATGTMSVQRGVMENDQRARAWAIILTNDLNNRSLRYATPFQPNEVDYAASLPYSFVERQGFISISENDINNDTDDVLHLTAIFSAQTADDTTSDDANVYYGRATQFAGTVSDLLNYPNQPEVDDGSTYPNATATSRMAEIVYFVRNGNLYRRVMLIREPLADAFDNQPFDSVTFNYFDYITNPNLPTPLPYYPATSDFWRDFDFSATRGVIGARFIGSGTAGINPLSNGPAGGYFPIGIPRFRFGHDPDSGNANTSSAPASVGNPREFVGTQFIGRFTHEETSHSNFSFPHSPATFEIDSLPGTPYSFSGSLGNAINDGNPMKTIGVATNPLSDLNGNSIVDQFEAGELDTRRGEDMLLSNVHAFDVKVWDEIIGDYVDVGHTLTSGAGTAGDFHQGRNRRPSYGPKPAGNNRMFDTWHPTFDANNDATLDANDRPPFLPKKDYTAFSTWTNNNSYAVNDIVIPTNSSVESFYYVCTVAGTSAALAAGEPNWPKNPNQSVQDGSVVWQAVYNLKPVKSLRITIRYLDVTSDQMRQVTLIQSLMN